LADHLVIFAHNEGSSWKDFDTAKFHHDWSDHSIVRVSSPLLPCRTAHALEGLSATENAAMEPSPSKENRSPVSRPATRLALIGCGFYAQNHLHAWRDLRDEGVVLAAVCDQDADRAKKAGATFGVPWYDDAGTMLAEIRPDLVDIATQMRGHRSLVELVAGHGIGFIVQKPLGPNWEDCVAMADAAARAGVFAAVHENFRYQPQMTRVQSLLAAGTIGSVTFMRISFRIGLDVYATQPYLLTEPRGIVLDVGIHLLDLARFFCGEVERVSAEMQRRNPRVAAEDTATMVLRHTNGAVSIVDCTYESRRVPDTFPETLLEVEGTDGAIALHCGGRLLVTERGQLREEIIPLPSLAWADPRWQASQIAVLETNRSLLRCLREGRPADTSLLDNLKTYALVDAAYDAARCLVATAPLEWAPTAIG
jgi:predicted dehydrogenase